MYIKPSINLKNHNNKFYTRKHRPFLLLLIMFQLVLLNYISKNNARHLNSYYSEINLVIEGSGTQNLLYSAFNYSPSEVFVNGIDLSTTCGKTCLLEGEKSNITLRFAEQFLTFGYMFKGLKNITEIEFSEFDSSGVKDMIYMFNECSSLKKVNFGNINTSSVTNMGYLFRNCSSLEWINFSNLDTSLVTNMNYMFLDCTSLTSINLTSFNTSNVQEMRTMFKNCEKLKSLDLSNFDFSNVKTMSNMFAGCKKLSNINFGNSSTPNLEDVTHLFSVCNSLSSLDISNFDTSKIKFMGYMFNRCINLVSLNLTNFIFSNVETIHNIFYGCKALKALEISNFNISKVKDMSSMFNGCSSLEKLDLLSINTSSVENVNSLFNGCEKLKEINLSNFDTSLVTNMEKMFSNCDSLASIVFPESFNTSQVEKMSYMFNNCRSLTSLDLTNFDITKVSEMEYMFNNCEKLQYLDVSNFYSKNINSIKSLFNNCKSLIYLNLISFEINGNTNTEQAFNLSSSIIKFCLNETNIIANLLEAYNYSSDCSNICFQENVKIDLNNSQCICTDNAYITINNPNICYNSTPEGYYFNNNESIYFECFNTCKFCNGPGDEFDNNCLECLDNHSFLNDSLYNMSCYKQCDNFYYFDENNKYICTENEICPDKFSKLIINKKKCIDECEKDDFYKYEFNNYCFDKCPNGTLESENNYICLNKTSFKSTIITYEIPQTSYVEEGKLSTNLKPTIISYIIPQSSYIENDKQSTSLKSSPVTNIIPQTSYRETNNELTHLKYTDIPNKIFKSSNIENEEELTYSKSTIISNEIFQTSDIVQQNELTILKSTIVTNEEIKIPSITQENELTNLKSTTILDKIIQTSAVASENELTNLKSTSISNKLIQTSNMKNENDNDINNSYEQSNYINTNKTELNFSTPIEVQKYFQKSLSEEFDTTDIDKGIDCVYSKGRATFTITTPSNQRNNKNNNGTIIYLGKCEEKLREEYKVPKEKNLYIFKIDYYLEDLLGPKVEYEVYYPDTKNQLKLANLSLCDEVKIEVSIPIDIPLSELDKYNASSAFYNDLCYPITTEFNTDLSLKDRREEFIKNNISICEEDCQFAEYDKISRRAICSCFTKIQLPVVDEIRVDKKKFWHNFYDINNIANIKMVKCLHLLFNKDNILKNSANYMLVALLFFDILSAIVFCFHNFIKINNDINQIYSETKLTDINKTQLETNKDKKEEKNKSSKKLTTINKKKDNNNKLKENELPKINKNIKKRKTMFNKNPNHFKKKLETKNNVNNKNNNNNKNASKRNGIDDNKDNKPLFLNINVKSKKKKKKPLDNINKNKNKKEKDNSMKPLKRKSTLNLQKSNLNNKKENEKIEIVYRDVELNSMDYEDALKYDQRNFSQYYFSLIKSQNPLIFTFYECKDYNSQMIKINLFFFSFSINYIISAMFYTDDTMHKIYIDEGGFDFTYMLPQMFYSLILSIVLGMIIKNLGLYQDNILNVRKLKRNKESPETIFKEVSKKIKIKIIFFFIISYILAFSFWAFLGSFCAVYSNTQIHLLIEVSSSFGISFITPFFIYLIPGFLRTKALQDRKKERPCLYRLSKITQIL